MEILLKNKDAVIVFKEAGIPSQPDPSGDADALTLTSEQLSAMGEKGDVYPVHRLDRVVGGVMLIARNKTAAAAFSALVAGEGIGKEYIAVLDGYLEGGRLCDYLYKDARAGKSFVVDRLRAGVKTAELDFVPIAIAETEKGIKTLVKVKLKTGRFHQIRAQFASRGVPLTGDGKYGSRDNRAHMPALFAFRISFEYRGERTEAIRLPNLSEYPWCLFDKQKYGEL